MKKDNRSKKKRVSDAKKSMTAHRNKVKRAKTTPYKLEMKRTRIKNQDRAFVEHMRRLQGELGDS